MKDNCTFDLSNVLEGLGNIERALFQCVRAADKSIESADVTGPGDVQYFKDINNILEARYQIVGAIYKLNQVKKG